MHPNESASFCCRPSLESEPSRRRASPRSPLPAAGPAGNSSAALAGRGGSVRPSAPPPRAVAGQAIGCSARLRPSLRPDIARKHKLAVGSRRPGTQRACEPGRALAPERWCCWRAPQVRIQKPCGAQALARRFSLLRLYPVSWFLHVHGLPAPLWLPRLASSAGTWEPGKPDSVRRRHCGCLRVSRPPARYNRAPYRILQPPVSTVSMMLQGCRRSERS